MSLQTIFINNLRKYRKQKKFTQEKLADLCDTDTSYIGQIEIGKRFPSISLIEKIAKALDIDAYVLFKEEIDEDTNKYSDLILQVAEDITQYAVERMNKELPK